MSEKNSGSVVPVDKRIAHAIPAKPMTRIGSSHRGGNNPNRVSPPSVFTTANDPIDAQAATPAHAAPIVVIVSFGTATNI
jgi:hypothetical protein